MVTGAVFAPSRGSAQPRASMPRVVFVSVGPATEAFRLLSDSLQRVGWRPGQTIDLTRRDAAGQPDRLAGIAQDLRGSPVDVVVTLTPDVAVAMNATARPVVAALLVDPVGVGLIHSFARPGGNVTGITYDGGPEFVGKRLQLLREVLPGAKRVAALVNLTLPGMQAYTHEYETRARAMGFASALVSVDRPDAVAAALARAKEFGPDVLFVAGGFFAPAPVRRAIVDFAAQHRLPALYPSRVYVADGGLMYYGPDLAALFDRVAAYVDRILKGAKPADLPVEQPTKFEMVLNAKTARALGLTLPRGLLLQADEVIE